MQNTPSSIVLILLSFVLFGCGRRADVHWADGNFKVYATDVDFAATKLGYDHRPGLLGLVDSEVVAAGSNAEVVVAERRNHSSGLAEFYIVLKADADNTHSGASEGPYTIDQFNELKAKRTLPTFSWRK